MSRIHRHPRVGDDIYDLTLHLLDQSEDAAYRFVTAVEISLKNLAWRPGVGSLKQYEDPRLHGIRTWWVEGFSNHLIYYFALPEGIDVLAVMHGSRDAETRLGDRLGD